MKSSRWAAAAAGLAVGALALAGPAGANHNDVNVDITTDGCQFTATSSWASDEHVVDNTVVVVRVGDEAHNAAVGVHLTLTLPAGTTTVEWRVWGGGERDYDDPALTDLPALLAHLEAGGDELDADAPGVAWHTLKVDGCEPEPTPTPTTTASPEPTVAPSSEPTAEPSGTPAPGVGGERLPTTGSTLPLFGGVAAALLAAGGGLYLLARRRRVSFTA